MLCCLFPDLALTPPLHAFVPPPSRGLKPHPACVLLVPANYLRPLERASPPRVRSGDVLPQMHSIKRMPARTTAALLISRLLCPRDDETRYLCHDLGPGRFCGDGLVCTPRASHRDPSRPSRGPPLIRGPHLSLFGVGNFYKFLERVVSGRLPLPPDPPKGCWGEWAPTTTGPADERQGEFAWRQGGLLYKLTLEEGGEGGDTIRGCHQ
jgi:hypothetical protein